MAQNNPKRRRAITTAVILGVALIGLLLITSGRSDEKAMLFAQTAVPADTVHAVPAYQPMAGTTTAAMSIFKMILALVVVIACIYGGIWFLKKLMGKQYTNGRRSYLLEVLETAYIDPKKSLSLVRVADKSVLIGVTDNQISVLTELDTELTKAVMETAARDTKGDSFATMLKSATQKFTGFGRQS